MCARAYVSMGVATTAEARLKRLNYKELSSRPVDLSSHGLDALYLSLLKTAGTTADKKWKERKL